MSHFMPASDASVRLKRARENAGFPTAVDFARTHGLNKTTYMHHESGYRDMTPDRAVQYASFLKLRPAELLYGEQLRPVVEVPIVGTINECGVVEPMTETLEGPPPSITLPDTTDMLSHRVVGDDLYPAYRDGDLVFHHVLASGSFHLQNLHGLECIVELEGGRRLLRQVAIQGDGRATLIAYQRPPLLDQVIVAAAPVELVKRQMPRLLFNR